MKKRIFALLFIISSFCCWTNAQRSYGGFPLHESSASSLRSLTNDEWVEMPPFDLSMVQKDSSQLKIGGLQFAHAFKTQLTPLNCGESKILNDGSKLWRVKIRSTEALSINLIFDKFHLEGDSKLFIYSPDYSTILGAYTKENNRLDSILATTPIGGDEVIVEYIEEDGATGEISIGQVNHGFRDFRAFPSFGLAAECNADVSCQDVPDGSRRCVALMIVNGTNMCSGSLINNTQEDGTPYFLTAAHCFSLTSDTLSASYLASTCLYFFNYETPYCLPNVQGSLEMSLSGSTVRAILSTNDMILMKLDEKPPVEYNTYYAGWNISPSIEGTVYTVHHPRGDVKKFARSLSAPIPTTFNNSDINLTTNVHWIVSGWEKGVTEGGSSGSPLFDSDNRIIGALTGGYEPSGCDLKSRDAFYRINTAWKGRNENRSLYNWLDPTQSEKTVLNGLEPYQYSCERLSNYHEGDKLFYSEEYLDENFIAGSNEHEIYEFAEKFDTDGGLLLGCYLIAEEATYHAEDTIWLKIYEGNLLPEKLLHKQRVRIAATQYGSNGFVEKEFIQLSSRDNYLHFTTPVEVDSTFFVAIEIPQNMKKKFGILAAEATSSNTNTAYYKSEDSWKQLSESPIAQRNFSLFLNPLMQTQKKTSIYDTYSDEHRVQIYPNPTSGEVQIICDEQPSKIELFSMRGEILNVVYPQSKISTLQMDQLPCGIYVVRVVFESHSERVKIIKQ